MNNQDVSTEINRLTNIMTKLRSEDGCPWDREQTPQSLKKFILEEAYELIESIDEKKTQDICDELGDLLLQIIFISQIYTEQLKFTFADVAYNINEKMIRRHPHVFSHRVNTELSKQWDDIKQQERLDRGKCTSLENTISRQLPALTRTSKAISKTQTPEPTQQYQKLNLLCSKLINTQKNNQDQENLLSDMLFNMVQLCVSLGYDAEDMLRKKTTEYIRNCDNKIATDASQKSKVG